MHLRSSCVWDWNHFGATDYRSVQVRIRGMAILLRQLVLISSLINVWQVKAQIQHNSSAAIAKTLCQMVVCNDLGRTARWSKRKECEDAIWYLLKWSTWNFQTPVSELYEINLAFCFAEAAFRLFSKLAILVGSLVGCPVALSILKQLKSVISADLFSPWPISGFFLSSKYTCIVFFMSSAIGLQRQKH